MPFRVHFWASGLLAGMILCMGCQGFRSGTNSSRQASTDSNAAAAAQVDYSPEAVEARIEAHARYASGVLHDLNKETEEAVENYYQAVLHDPKNERLVLDVTRRFLQLKENDKALSLLEKAAKQKNVSAGLLTRLALVQAAQGQEDQAIATCRRAIAKDGRAILAYQQLAQILMRKERYEEAAEAIRNAKDQASRDVGLLLDLADLCLNLARADREQADSMRALAADILAQADQAGTENPLFLQKLADTFSLLGETDRATDIYLQILDRFPHLPGLRERLVEIYLRAENPGKAKEQLEAILASNPTNLRAHYLLGSLAYEQENLDAAKEHYAKVILLNPDFEQAYYELSGVLIGLDQEEEALAILQKARDRFEDGFLVEFYTGLTYGRMEDYPQALKHYEAAEIIARATDTNRLTKAFYFQLGAAYERNKQYDDAEQYFRKCLAEDGEYAIALNYLAYMWAEQDRNLQEAYELMTRALALEPTNAAFLDSMAWVLFKLERAPEALEYMHQAMEHSEELDPVMFDHIGDIYAALNQLDKAREAWRKALSLEPNELIEQKLHGDTQADQAASQPEAP